MHGMNIEWIRTGPEGGGHPPPSAARVWSAENGPRSVARATLRLLASSPAEFCLFWDSKLPLPSEQTLAALCAAGGDVWHAGLRLGLGGKPALLDFARPLWMLNRDPSPAIRTASWRVSLRACLVRTEVLRRHGGPRPDYETLAAAGLEWGHRLIRGGALVEHVPALLPNSGDALAPERAEQIPLDDELRFVLERFGAKWLGWSALRAVLSGLAGPGAVLQAAAVACSRTGSRMAGAKLGSPPRRAGGSVKALENADCERLSQSRVSVVIPTLGRYPYLRKVLSQLAGQTVPPLEVLVVDQTPAAQRADPPQLQTPGLPLQLFTQERAGQCSARNRALRAARGEFILLLDDDVEIGPDLVERHLAFLERTGADASCGVVDEPGAPAPEPFLYERISDVFPAGNTLLRRSLLTRAGLFDPAYDGHPFDDADLGMRAYLAGARVLLNPSARVLHHRAPAGGLRTHGARRITHAASRTRLFTVRLPDAAEFFYARRYFTPRHAREAFWQWAFGTLSVRGGPLQKLVRLCFGVARLPLTVAQLRRREREAGRLIESFPETPEPERAAAAGAKVSCA